MEHVDYDPRFFERVEDLAIEELVPELRVEALDIAVLPRAARCDVGRLCADSRDTGLDGLSDELGPVVGSDMAGVAGSMRAKDSSLTAFQFADIWSSLAPALFRTSIRACADASRHNYLWRGAISAQSRQRRRPARRDVRPRAEATQFEPCGQTRTGPTHCESSVLVTTLGPRRPMSRDCCEHIPRCLPRPDRTEAHLARGYRTKIDDKPHVIGGAVGA